MNDEGELIDRTLQGDADAFGTLVRRYQDRLYTSMVHLLHNESDAQDTVQEAFLQALTQLSTFSRKSSFYTWLYRIAFNRALNRRKRQQRERELVGQQVVRNDTVEDAGRNLERRETVAQVRKALASLDPTFRAVLVLREIEQLDYRTIAEILDIQVGTVRSRLHRARILLREALDRILSSER